MARKEPPVRRGKSKAISWTRKPRRGVVVKKSIDWGKLLKNIITRIRFWTSFFLMFLVIASPYLAWKYFEEHEVFVIERVTVLGNVHYLPLEELRAVTEQALHSNFIGFDVSKFQHDLESIAWIKSVKVTRKWFNELEVNIVERSPVAAWNYDTMLEKDGTAFKPEILSQGFVRLIASDGYELTMLAKMDEVKKKLALIDLQLKELSLDHRLSWSFILDNDIEVILGTENFTLRLNRFINHYPNQLSDKANQIRSVDLRYENGFAVKWRNEDA